MTMGTSSEKPLIMGASSSSSPEEDRKNGFNKNSLLGIKATSS